MEKHSGIFSKKYQQFASYFRELSKESARNLFAGSQMCCLGGVLYGLSFYPPFPGNYQFLSFLLRLLTSSAGLILFCRTMASLQPPRVLYGFIYGLSFGGAFIFASLFGIYKAFLLTGQLLLFLPCLLFLALYWGSILGGAFAVQQLLLKENAYDKTAQGPARPALSSASPTSSHASTTTAGDLSKKSNIMEYLCQKTCPEPYPMFTLTFSLCWFLFEMCRGAFFLQFPWNLTAQLFAFENISIARVFIQIIHLCGSVFLSALWVMFLASFFCDRSVSLRIVTGTSMVGVVVFGVVMLSKPAVVGEKVVPLLIIQPNVSQETKLIKENQASITKEMISLLNKYKKNSNKVAPKMVIFPETAITQFITTSSNIISKIQAAAGDSVVVFGADRIDPAVKTPKWYNSMFIVSKKGVERVYDKIKLLPFGEYVPLRTVFPTLFSSATNSIDCTPGTNSASVSIPGIPQFQARICSEMMHKQTKQTHAKVRVRRGRRKSGALLLLLQECAPERVDPNNKWTLQILNDGWFARPILWQHLAVDRLRVIESGVPLVRVANTGISCMIDGKGEVTDMIPPGTQAGRMVMLTDTTR
ncbi:MAG: apolipoprotein N-acyltransferase [Holosporales bacterium]|nr:apolipoprotein N-acyltransferase [Holosporales bacterium]